MSAALKKQGDAHFRKKEWQSAAQLYTKALAVETDPIQKALLFANRSASSTELGKFENAVADAQSWALGSPKSNKAWVCLAKAWLKIKRFDDAVVAYEKAVETAPDPQTKRTCVVALKKTKAIRDRQPKEKVVDMLVGDFERSPVAKIKRAVAEGYQVKVGSSLALLLANYDLSLEGFWKLERNVFKTNGRVLGGAGSTTNQELSECIMVDTRTFIITEGSDPSFNLSDRLNALGKLDAEGLGLVSRYREQIIAHDGKAIVADLNRRLPQEGWAIVRRSCSVLSRGNIINAYIERQYKRFKSAARLARMAVDVLEEGNRLWPDNQVSYDDKGHSFKSTLVRLAKTYLMEVQLDVTREDGLASSLRAVEATANEILNENPQKDWLSNHIDPARYSVNLVSRQVLPTARAYCALAICSGFVAQATLDDIPPRRAVTANIEYSQKASRYYELAVRYLPEDDSRKTLCLFGALEYHFLAGGKTVGELLKLADEAEKLRKEFVRFYEELESPNTSIDFVTEQAQDLRNQLSHSKDEDFVNKVVKPVTTGNVTSLPVNYSLLEMWRDHFQKMPGDVIILRVVGNEKIVDGYYA